MNNDTIIGIKAKNPLKRLGIALLLWLVSFILKYIVTIISAIVLPVVYVCTLQWKSGINALADWLYRLALSNDQHGNVANDRTFKYLLTKRGRFDFGNPDDTISYVIARNKYRYTLNFTGRLLGTLLDKVDSTAGGHLYKAILMKKRADIESAERSAENKYFN